MGNRGVDEFNPRINPMSDPAFRAWFHRYAGDSDPVRWDAVYGAWLSGGYRLVRAYQLGMKPSSAGHFHDFGPHHEPIKTWRDPNRITKGIDNATGFQVAPPTYTGPMTAAIARNASRWFHAHTATRPGGPAGWDDVPAGKFAPALTPPKGYAVPPDPALEWIERERRAHDERPVHDEPPAPRLVHELEDDDVTLPVIMAKVREMIDAAVTKPKWGLVADGSWNPAEGTISVVDAETFSAIPPDLPQIIPNVPLLTTGVGDQAAPRAGDRVLLMLTGGGYVAWAFHGPDDTPGAPLGERWITLRNALSGSALGTLKLTQNGAQTTDGAGGFAWSGGTLVQLATAGGLEVSINDHAGQVVVGKPGGLEVVIDTQAGTVSVGGTGLTQSANGVVREPDLQAALNTFATTMQAFISAHCASGTQTAPAITAPTAGSSSTTLAK